MSGTRLNNIAKHLECVTDQVKPVRGESKRFTAKPSPVMLRAARRTLFVSVAIWSILELPIDLILAQSLTERLAAVVGRLIWVVFAIGAISRKRFATSIFLFLCAAGSLVVAQTLPMVYESSVVVFSVLVVDLALKLSALLASLILSLTTPNSGGHKSA